MILIKGEFLMKRYKILLGILIFSLIFFGAIGTVYTQGDGSQSVPQARFAFYHASPNAPAVDIIVEDEVLFSNVGFNTKTSFQLIEAGDLTLSINVAGTDQVVLGPVKASIKQGRDHILFVTGMVEGDTDSDLPKLTAKLLVKKTRPAFFRFYNTSPDVGKVNVYLDNNLYFENVEYDKPTKFEKIGSGNLELSINKGGDSVISPSRVNFEPGKAYTIVLVGLDEGQGLTSLQVEVIEE
jgi:hypothetical protein